VLVTRTTMRNVLLVVGILATLAADAAAQDLRLVQAARAAEQAQVIALLDSGETILDRTSDRREYIKLPDERIGTMFVFRVFDDISYALVLRVTKPVKVGDRFMQPD